MGIEASTETLFQAIFNFRKTMVEVLFLGTAGARYVVAKQFRASGGLILRQEKGCLLIDPGPGTLVQLAKQKISPEKKLKLSFLPTNIWITLLTSIS